MNADQLKTAVKESASEVLADFLNSDKFKEAVKAIVDDSKESNGDGKDGDDDTKSGKDDGETLTIEEVLKSDEFKQSVAELVAEHAGKNSGDGDGDDDDGDDDELDENAVKAVIKHIEKEYGATLGASKQVDDDDDKDAAATKSKDGRDAWGRKRRR